MFIVVVPETIELLIDCEVSVIELLADKNDEVIEDANEAKELVIELDKLLNEFESTGVVLPPVLLNTILFGPVPALFRIAPV